MEETLYDVSTSLNNFIVEQRGREANINFVSDMAEEAERGATRANSRLDVLEATVESLVRENRILRNEVGEVTTRLVRNEAYSRRDNLVLYGLKEDAAEKPEETMRKMRQVMAERLGLVQLSREIQIVRCHRKGKSDTRGHGDRPPRARPIITRFQWYGDRQAVWRARGQLRDTPLALSEDFPEEYVEDRKVLKPALRAAIAEGKTAHLQVNKLYCEGRLYSPDNLPENLSKNKSEKSSTSAHVFFGSECFLSNFHKGDLSIDNIKYTGVEQYLQAQKADAMGDQKIAQMIRDEPEPAKQKRLAKRIRGFNVKKWEEIRKDLLLRALRVKFSDPRLATMLTATGHKALAEASRDADWGCGLGLHDEHVLDHTRWVAGNILGKALEKVRDEL